VIAVHPAADLFPMMSEPELRSLGEDIKKNGLLSPITIGLKVGINYGSSCVDDYELWDGRNRLAAMELMGMSPLTFNPGGRRRDPRWMLDDVVGYGCDTYTDNPVRIETSSEAGEAYEYIIGVNIRRRHLTAEQKGELIGKLLKANPTKSNRQIAKIVGASHPRVAKERKALEKSGDVETVTTSIDTQGRAQPAKKATKPKQTVVRIAAPVTETKRIESVAYVRDVPLKPKPIIPSKTTGPAAASQALPGSIGPMWTPPVEATPLPAGDPGPLPPFLDLRERVRTAERKVIALESENEELKAAIANLRAEIARLKAGAAADPARRNRPDNKALRGRPGTTGASVSQE
jgi:DNA-binding Lrp family transcriptional regulator